MKKLLKLTLIAAVLFIGVAFPVLHGTETTYAVNAIEEACNANGASALCNDDEGADISTVIRVIVNVLLFIVGLVSVIMIIIGGIRYTTSGGNAASVTAAKNTILYAIIGLIVAFVAFAVVDWVINLIKT